MNISPGQRFASLLGGVVLLRFGRRLHLPAVVSRSVALGLVARGASGYCPVVDAVDSEQSLADTKAALSGSHGVHVREAITIAKPRAEVYRYWRELERLPEVLTHLREVHRAADDRSTWTDEGRLGVPVTWEAELINEIENEMIAWRSVRSRVVTHAGSIRFREVPAGTEVLLHLQYRTLGGPAGRLAAALLGHRPQLEAREDLRRVKQILETGETPTTAGQPAGHVERWSDTREGGREAAAS